MPVTVAPYDINGNLMSWASGREPGLQWIVNDPIPRTMALQGQRRGQSAAKFIWHDERGRKYEMFMSDMLALVQEATIVRGVITGLWKVVKKGQNYGIKYVGELDG